MDRLDELSVVVRCSTGKRIWVLLEKRPKLRLQELIDVSLQCDRISLTAVKMIPAYERIHANGTP